MSTTVVINGLNYYIPAVGENNWGQNVSDALIALATATAGSAGFLNQVSVSSSPITVVSGRTYLVDTSSARTLNLPAPANNAYLQVKDVTGSSPTNNITIHRFGSEEINGVAADKVLSTSKGMWTFISDGTNWFMLDEEDTQTLGRDGTVSLPFYTFGLDTDSGIYRVGADIVGIATGGVVGITINASQQLTIPKTSSQLVLGTTNTTTISATAPAASRVYTIPDVLAAADFVMTAGSQTILGNKTFGAGGTGSANSIVVIDGSSAADYGAALRFARNSVVKGAIGHESSIIGGTSDSLVLYAVASTTVKLYANAAEVLRIGTAQALTVDGSNSAPAYSFISDPDTGIYRSGANTLDFALAGVQKITIDSAGNLIMRGGEIDLSSGTVSNPSLNFLSDPNTGLYSIGADNLGIATNGTKRVDISTAAITLSLPTAIQGTATNDSAAAGYVGQYVESVVGSGSVGTNAQYFDVTSISLTAGDWDVTGIIMYFRNGASWTGVECGISQTSGNSGVGLVAGSSDVYAYHTAAGTSENYRSLSIPSLRISLSGTTTIYLKGYAEYTAATPNRYGRLSARRVR